MIVASLIVRFIRSAWDPMPLEAAMEGAATEMGDGVLQEAQVARMLAGPDSRQEHARRHASVVEAARRLAAVP
ncbi:hypothetical protein [Stenotrophomonas sp. MMGLT7]|uniref:hypothetical protein n=1 Tax=Stenotrophomonas sp. MMGLT7 TaxID=2901227 RepID=UPI001E418D5D|nr:hypothetical protein [Stenotrophomonas sp. MMGLT7]MCD7098430.1 hypothetical protein [Stenotrophomonas sp. MMGLT7]